MFKLCFTDKFPCMSRYLQRFSFHKIKEKIVLAKCRLLNTDCAPLTETAKWSTRLRYFPVGAACLILSMLTLTGQAHAEIRTRAAEFWTIGGGTRSDGAQTGHYKSFEEAKAAINAEWEQYFNDCMSYGETCGKLVVTGKTPTGSLIVYGEPAVFMVTGYSFNVSAQGSKTRTFEEMGYYKTTERHFFCPSDMSFSWAADGPYCSKKTPTVMDCSVSPPVLGNPINTGTGEKTEHAIDYSTADGYLKVERFYANQYEGWRSTQTSTLIDLTHRQTQTQCYGGMITRRVYDPVTSTTRMIPEPTCINYLSSSGINNEVLLQQKNGYRITFKETSPNVFTGNTPYSGQLEIINPDVHQGATWLHRLNNQKYYYNAKGQLTKVIHANGRHTLYSYSGGRLVDVADDVGRKLQFRYDAKNNLTAVDLPDGGQITYAYSDTPFPNTLRKVIRADGSSETYLYNEPGLIDPATVPLRALTGKLDSNGERVGTYRYDAKGFAVSTEGALGADKLTFAGFGGSTQVTNPSGSLRTLTFQTLTNGAKVLASTSQPAGSGCAASSESISYYADGLKRVETNFNGHKTQFAYDHARGLETVRVEGILKTDYKDYLPEGTALGAGVRKISTQWHSTQRHKIKTAEPKLITHFIYNGDGDPFDNHVAACAPTDLVVLCRKVQQATTDTNGALGFSATPDTSLANREWFYTYNERGQVLTVRRSPTATPDYSIEYYDTTTYDWTRGDRKSLINALGHVIHFDRYDPNGRLLQMTDANGIATQFTYDVRGRLTSQSLNGEITSHSYDLNGNRIGSVLPNGVAITYHYDAAKRLTAIENAAGDKINYEYDVENNLRFERITDSGGTIAYLKEHVYDALSRVQNTIDSENHSTTYLYDPMGNLTGEQDAKQQTTNHVFDALNQPKQTTDALNGKTDYSYDAQGNLTQVKDAKGLSTTYRYNAFGDLVEQVSPDTNTTTYTYDNAGNRTSATDSRGVVVNYTYDALNRLTQVQYPASPAENVTYEYDARTTTNRGIGRLTRISKTGFAMSYLFNHQGLVTQKNANVGGIIRTVKYAYDRAGQLTSITYPSGRIVSYSYEGVGRIASVKIKTGTVVTTLVNNINYLPFGPAYSYTYGNGLNLTHTYDQDYRLNAIDVGGSKSILDRDYAYDPVNNITGITNHLDTSKSQNYDYDSLNRLTAASGMYGLLGYTYDAVGNRLSEHQDDGSQVRTDTYTYSSTRHRLASITRRTTNQPNSTRNFTYDAAGNRIAGKTEDGKNQSYTYDKANRLSAVSVNNIAAASYMYNPLGQRVSKTVGSTKELYFYDEAGQLIAVTNSGGTTLREYIYLDSQQVAFINNGSIYYIHNDHLNTPQVVTDQNQQVVWMGDYQPFGKLATTQTNSIELYSRFPGQYLDSETGLYYNYFRDYDPSVGRYIQSDPIGLGGGINTYAYVEGDPISKTDPLGLRASYCQRPLNDPSGENGAGPPVFNHQFICVTLADGTVRCDSQNNPADDNNGFFWPSPGAASLPENDNEENSVCEDIDDDEDRCFERCVIEQWTQARPDYAIGPLGTDCQEYSSNIVAVCRTQCDE